MMQEVSYSEFAKWHVFRVSYSVPILFSDTRSTQEHGWDVMFLNTNPTTYD